ncbi:MAG: preprotein translocase subunit SecE [Parcubacteria group bacterium]|nr:preprotein translocase subunit SecE [Parcubacteria group bacterium]|tara:strand:- start:220 stop:408 length:189 start_codon:yes stop_codon:yes gene_type:complete
MNILSHLFNYIKASQQELKKVVWPTKKEVIHHTVLVIVISLGVAAFLGLADYFLTIIVGTIL